MINTAQRCVRRAVRQGSALAVAALAVCLAPLAHAWNVDLYNANISQVGAHEGSLAFLVLQEPVHASCPSGTLYYDISTPLGRSMHAVLVSG